MIDISVGIYNKDALLNPTELHGIRHGEVYQMYDDGKPSDTFFIGCGYGECLISIWWCEDDCVWKMSTESEEELNDYYPHIKVKHCPNSKVELKLSVNR